MSQNRSYCPLEVRLLFVVYCITNDPQLHRRNSGQLFLRPTSIIIMSGLVSVVLMLPDSA